MKMILHRVAFLFMLTGCQVTAERVAVMPLPEEGAALSYADVLQRARFQATSANEAFYLDKWTDLQEAAAALEKTARYLPKSSEVPDARKTDLATRVTELTKLTSQLSEAAKGQDVKKANEALQQINLKIRELRSEK
jgi:hypothetical protein